MYDVALSVLACLRADTDVHIAWIPTSDVADGTAAVALTPGGGRIGSLLGGAFDDALVEAAARLGTDGGITDLVVGPAESIISGLPQETALTVAIVPGSAVPQSVWQSLADRQPVAFGFGVEGNRFTETYILDTDDPPSGASPNDVVCRFQPVTRMVIVGGGPIADALADGFNLVGWQTVVVGHGGAEGATTVLSHLDGVVVMGHDVETSARALQAAIASKAGYIGSVGSEDMQRLRQEWLAYRGVDWDDRIHGPAGFPIGASNPGEIAVSIVAEAVASTRLEDLSGG